MRSLVAIVSFIVLSHSAIAQSNLDSLWQVWADETVEDTVRCKAIDDFIWFGYLYSDTDSALVLSQLFYDFAKEQGLSRQQCMALNTIGTCHWAKSSYIEAINYLKQSLELSESINNISGIASALNNIGGIYSDQGYDPKALQYFKRSKELHEAQRDTQSLAVVIGNIGKILIDQGELDIAEDYFEESLALYKQAGDQVGVAISLVDLGALYASRGDYEAALDSYQQAIAIREMEQDLNRLVSTLEMTGSLYAKMGEFENAKNYHEKAIELATEIRYRRRYAIALMTYGRTLAMFDKNDEAKKKCEEAYYLLRDLSILKQQKQACNCLYQVYRDLGNEKEALKFFELEMALKDSLQATETVKKLQQMEFEKLVLADSAKHYSSQLELKSNFEKQIIKEHNVRNIAIASSIFALLLAMGLYQRSRFIKQSNLVLQRERDRSDELLLNILPVDVAEELKVKGESEAKDFDNVTVLFTDFMQFTQTAEQLSAKELVSEINTCFKAFDEIMTKYKLEKIKTIGDAYMAAGGLHVPRTSEPKDVVQAALEMQTFMIERKASRSSQNLPAFDMRVGIHTGPVVAGIVGVKKFQYDIWGDTVNTASRMESHGKVGKVNISNDTYELLKDDAQFTFESRGQIEVKGKGKLEMYFVNQKESQDDHAKA